MPHSLKLKSRCRETLRFRQEQFVLVRFCAEQRLVKSEVCELSLVLFISHCKCERLSMLLHLSRGVVDQKLELKLYLLLKSCFRPESFTVTWTVKDTAAVTLSVLLETEWPFLPLITPLFIRINSQMMTEGAITISSSVCGAFFPCFLLLGGSSFPLMFYLSYTFCTAVRRAAFWTLDRSPLAYCG